MPGESPQQGLWHKWSKHQKQSAVQIPVEILSALQFAFLSLNDPSVDSEFVMFLNSMSMETAINDKETG